MNPEVRLPYILMFLQCVQPNNSEKCLFMARGHTLFREYSEPQGERCDRIPSQSVAGFIAS